MAKMTKAKWRQFRWSFSVFLVLAVWFLWERSVFSEPSLAVSGIVAFAFVAIAVASYFFCKNLPDDLS
jgi:drug/metabolite transporter (DMT)-like permease